MARRAMGSHTLAISALLTACSFGGRTGEAVVDGTVGDDAPGAGEDARGATDAVACAAPIVIDDHFDNLDLATAGPLSTGDGFTSVTNASTGNGSSIEQAGDTLEIRTSNNGTAQAPSHGAASNTSFAFGSGGLTVRLEVSAADTPIWNGIALGIQSNKASTDSAGGSLMLRIRGQGTNAGMVDMGNQQPYDPSMGLQPYDMTALANGFVVTWILQPSGWSYVAQGLLDSGAALTDSGAYHAGQTPADLLGADAHLGIHIQGNPNDTNPRVLDVSRLTLWNGVCP